MSSSDQHHFPDEEFDSEDGFERLAEAVVFAHDAAIDLPPSNAESGEFERLAAIAAAVFSRTETVPESLAHRLSAQGLEFCAERAKASPQHAPLNHAPLNSGERNSGERNSGERATIEIDPASAVDPASGRIDAGNGGISQNSPPRAGAPALLMFFLGVAAVALVWVGIDVVTSGAVPIDARRTALATRSDTKKLSFEAGPSPLSGEVQGEVLWNDDLQEGYLTFEGLPPLDDQHRFQLWIVDAERPGSDPVDGGLFSIGDGSRTEIVPIDAKLPVRKAGAFVVTVEEWDGVVVSKQKDVVAIARL